MGVAVQVQTSPGSSRAPNPAAGISASRHISCVHPFVVMASRLCASNTRRTRRRDDFFHISWLLYNMAHLRYLATLHGPPRQENKTEKVTAQKASRPRLPSSGMTRAKAPEVRFPLPGSVPGSMPKTPGRGLCAGMGAQRCFDRRSPRWRAVPAWTASAVAANRMGCFSKQWVFFSASDIREGRWKDLQIFSFAPSQTHYQNGPEPIVIEGPGSARCVVPCALPAPSSHPCRVHCEYRPGSLDGQGPAGFSMLRNRR